MSTLQVLPPVSKSGPSVRPSKAERNMPAWTATVDPRRTSDQQMTHAWSIGVTDAGRFAQPEREPETCPPEVYIG